MHVEDFCGGEGNNAIQNEKKIEAFLYSIDNIDHDLPKLHGIRVDVFRA